MKWHLYANGKKEGPFSERQILELISDGKINKSAQVWSEATKVWVRIGTVPVFSEAFEQKYSAMEFERKSAIQEDSIIQPPTRDQNPEQDPITNQLADVRFWRRFLHDAEMLRQTTAGMLMSFGFSMLLVGFYLIYRLVKFSLDEELICPSIAAVVLGYYLYLSYALILGDCHRITNLPFSDFVASMILIKLIDLAATLVFLFHILAIIPLMAILIEIGVVFESPRAWVFAVVVPFAIFSDLFLWFFAFKVTKEFCFSIVLIGDNTSRIRRKVES